MYNILSNTISIIGVVPQLSVRKLVDCLRCSTIGAPHPNNVLPPGGFVNHMFKHSAMLRSSSNHAT